MSSETRAASRPRLLVQAKGDEDGRGETVRAGNQKQPGRPHPPGARILVSICRTRLTWLGAVREGPPGGTWVTKAAAWTQA